ncbi:MAG: hypothetical protein EOM29_08580 [Bacteroidia bacterium]|nr:hypothetical protein [Bacteroidia bacterium]
METNENQPIDENDLESTLADDRVSEEATDFENLFADDDDSQEDAPVTREEYNRLLKGVKKLASIQGQKKEQPKEKVETKADVVVSHQDDDVSELFFAQIPKAELVSEDLKKIAEAKYNGSILKAWKGESWIQEKATALEVARTEDEANKEKIRKPASGTAPSRVDISKIKPEDVASLPANKKAEWLKEQVRKERESAE